MKRILITGSNSYVGTNIEKWLLREPNNYSVDTLDMQKPNWQNYDFSGYDVVYHVAGIAHVSSKKSMEEIYYKVNRDLAIETARKALKSGVKQFIFMSSMIVYGKNNNRINEDSIPKPDNFYGRSKLEAETAIRRLEGINFKVAIIRAPFIYGKDCKGNYTKLSKLSKKLLVFPKFNNKRSVLYIENLSQFVKLLIDFNDFGIFFPQNKNYVSTYDFVKQISVLNKRKILFFSAFNFFFKCLKSLKYFNKVFGDFYYDHKISLYQNGNYQLVSFKESIKEIEDVQNGMD